MEMAGKFSPLSLNSTKQEQEPEETKNQASTDVASPVDTDTRHVAQKNGKEPSSIRDRNLDYENVTENLDHKTSTEYKTSFNDQMISLLNNSVDDVLSQDSRPKESSLITRGNVSSSREMSSKFNPQYDNKYVHRERNGRYKMLEALQDLRHSDIESKIKIDHDFQNHTQDESATSSYGIPPLAIEDSIILESLGLNISQGPKVVTKLSILDNKKSGLLNNDEQEIVDESTRYNSDEDDYLDYSEYADYYNDPVENTEDNIEDMLEVIKFRDYPMGDGYVRIPVYVPGLEVYSSKAPRF